MDNSIYRYTVYTKRRGRKRASACGIITDDLDRAKDIARRERASWWGRNGIYEWVKVRDRQTGKYIYEA